MPTRPLLATALALGLGGLVAATSGGFALVGCGANSTSACSGARVFPLTAVDDATRRGIGSPLFALEGNGLSRGSPSPQGSYILGGQGDQNGLWGLALACGHYGIHAFAYGYHCSSTSANNAGELAVGLTANDVNEVIPSISTATFADNSPTANSNVLVNVTTQAASASPADAVVTVLLIEATTYRAQALTAVEGAVNDGISQAWQLPLRTPSLPGLYTYQLVAATDACVASKITRVDLQSN